MKDRVAIIIAAGLISWGLVAIGCAAWRNKPLGEAGGEVLGLIAGSLGSALAARVTRNNGEPK